jgi:hypothetical protein
MWEWLERLLQLCGLVSMGLWGIGVGVVCDACCLSWLLVSSWTGRLPVRNIWHVTSHIIQAAAVGTASA